MAWCVFFLVAAALYGNFYVYDSVGPVAGLLASQRGFTDTQIGLLNAIYSLPNVVLILVGGVITDRFGAARVTVGTAGICLAGAALTALSPVVADGVRARCGRAGATLGGGARRRRDEGAGPPEQEELFEAVEQAGEGGGDQGVDGRRQQGAVLPGPLAGRVEGDRGADCGSR